MKLLAATLVSFSLLAGAAAAETKLAPSRDDIQMIAPGLHKYAQDRVHNGLWKRSDLSPRDRSIVTLSALIARNHSVELGYYANLALDSGVKPAEISEIITHLAFYAGWGNAVEAIPTIKEVFIKRGVKADELPSTSPRLLALDEKTEAVRATRVSEQFSTTSPGLVQSTTDVLFRDLWLRPGLAPRDRSLVTVTALIATGQVVHMPYHLDRAMDNGLTQHQAAEVIHHLAFYIGWPNTFSAMPLAKDVFEKRK